MSKGHLVGRLLLAGAFATVFGCELIASVDRAEIPPSEGPSSGSGGTGGETSTGGVAGSTGTGGTAGDGSCSVPADCGDSECVTYICMGGTCSELPKPAGTPSARQTTGDCKARQCDGAGQVEEMPDNRDVLADTNDCTDDLCVNGMPSNPNTEAETPCGDNGELKCDGLGHCVGCIDPTDCTGQDDECQQRTCEAGVCGIDFAPQGTELATQDPGDCQVAQCDGNGGVQSADDNLDLPVDGAECTADLCTDGDPSNPDLPSGTSCSGGNGQCNATGDCVECLGPADCPGVDNECQERTCVAGACGFNFSPPGTPVAAQTTGDCKQNQCDGAGNITVGNFDTDVPNDANPCSNDICSSGVRSHTNVGNGTVCGTGLACVDGACTGCAAPGTCPGTDDECKTRTCTAGTCGFSFTAGGTPVAMQTAGDCQQNQCDGLGNIQSVAANGDLPVDGNQCTSDVCTSGSPSNPLLPTDTPCTQGGSFCSPTGQCVACNQGSQCPGTDTDCQSRSCTSGTCGFSFAPNGTPTSMQTSGDCRINQCNGSGGVISAIANSDVPADDGQQCTGEVCNAGTPEHPALPTNTPCTQGGGLFCDGAGSCVQCNLATQCPGMDTDCQSRTCALHVCGTMFAPSGTPTSSQVSGDCKENQCNGSGGVMSANNNLDLPADDGNQCTDETCSSGTPQHPNEPAGASCNQNGGEFCNGAGACVAPTCTTPEAPGATCTSYCTCMTATCAGKFPSQAACIAACATFNEPQICCRAYHCTNAMADPVTHCPHAAGESLCP